MTPFRKYLVVSRLSLVVSKLSKAYDDPERLTTND